MKTISIKELDINGGNPGIIRQNISFIGSTFNLHVARSIIRKKDKNAIMPRKIPIYPNPLHPIARKLALAEKTLPVVSKAISWIVIAEPSLAVGDRIKKTLEIP